MLQLQELLTSYAWWVNGAAALIILLTRIFSNNKASWAFIGGILLLVALGNSSLLAPFITNANSQLAALFGTVVHGALGATFVANWLTDGAA